MGTYRKVDVRLWGDQKFLALPNDARLMWLYLLTCNPNNTVSGVIVNLTADMMAVDLRAGTVGKVKEIFGALRESGMAYAEWDRRLFWLPKGADYNPCPNENVAIGWLRQLDDLPECGLTVKIREAIRAHIEANPKTRDALTKDYRNGTAYGSRRVRRTVTHTVSTTRSDQNRADQREASPEPVIPPPTKEEEERMKTQEFVSGVLARTLGVNRG